MNILDVLNDLLPILGRAQRALESAIPKARIVNVGGKPTWRFENQDIHHALVMKLARGLSCLRAAGILHREGHVQEQAILHRVIDESNEDVLFLVLAVTNDEITELHRRYLDAFWREEVDEDGNFLGATDAREMVPRRRIQAYLAAVEGKDLDPHTHLNLSKVIHKAYSGFVHGAAPHIMDLYGGDPPKFHVAGMLETPRMEEYGADLWNYMYRTLISYILVFKAFGAESQVNELTEYLVNFEQSAGKDYSAGG